MKKSRAVSLLLSLSLLCALFLPLRSLTVYAQTWADENGKGMQINKTAEANSDGTYTITLEAYATGSKIITEVKKDIPTDIVLVLDQSGSMDESMATYGFRPYTDKTNSELYALRHNGARTPNLYYPLGDGSYATVSVTLLDGGLSYAVIPVDSVNTHYWNNRNNLYAAVNGSYQKVTLTREFNYYYADYTYALPDGTVIAGSQGRNGIPVFSGVDGGVLYLASNDADLNVYTYTCTDTSGAILTIGTSTGAYAQPTGFTLYERYTSGSTTKLQALKTAVTNFAGSVAKKAAGPDGDLTTTEDNVNHRIAVVGFASGSTFDGVDYNYGNTEVFIGSTGHTYGTSARSVYGSAFQSMDTAQGKSNVTASIGALDADGGTLTDLGMEMANGILNANPVPEGEKRSRVIVVFTDGAPGWSGYDSTIAQAAIRQANAAKTSGVTVYTVGVFAGANATSSGSQSGSDDQKSNWFMQNLSSNNGTPQKPSYYLSAGDSETLNSIFRQISDQIETGGSGTMLSDETVIRDIIAPAFTLPDGAAASDITLETYRYIGPNRWERNSGALGATAAVSGDTVSVSGFDFAEHYVGTVTENGSTAYRGNKLVISFRVLPKAGFLGGNNVCTNTRAGIYENSSAAEPVMTFPQPQVNVPIKAATVTAEDKNVYLLGDLTAEQLMQGVTVAAGSVALDLSKASDTAQPYGLEPWQTEYVDITVEVRDASGNAISTGLNKLTDDTTYTVSVTLSPKTNGSGASGTPAAPKTGANDPAANINVFKPELTFRDGEAWYGGEIPTAEELNACLTQIRWLHAGATADPLAMGPVPALTITCTPDAEGVIQTKQDVAVDAAVQLANADITAHCAFQHAACSPACGWSETAPDGTPAFLLHIRTCELTIAKTGGAAGEPYVFTIKKDGAAYTEVTVVGNASVTIRELPVGAYTIAEDTGWSWRYSPSCSGSAVLSKAAPSGSILCTNRADTPGWLNSYSAVAVNTFGSAAQQD